ncbi:MAG TPA: glycosyltransferase family 39 protein [Nitrososphaerales archaeon]|nr:glycosyltransferase family 39 protein [Nitrososphaerales archaeon]
MLIAAFDFVGHMLVAGNYGYFRDELYYIVSGQHLQLGYVDFPGMIAYLAALMGVAAGDNLVAIHVIPALAGASVVFVAGMTARELGGGRAAQVLAALGTLVTAQLAFASIFSMDILDMLWWSLCGYLLVRIVRRERPRLWLAFGLVAGLGLMTKLTIAFFLVALLAALVATKGGRESLRSRWLWVGAGVAFLFLAPYIAWNAMNGWPTLDFFLNHGGLNGGGPLSFAVFQVLIANPVNVPLAFAGGYFYLRSKEGSRLRFLGLALAILFFIFLLGNGKPYFYAGAYPILIAGGARLVEGVVRPRPWLPVALGIALVVTGAALAPLEMPILAPSTYAATYGALSGVANGAAGQGNAGTFPQYLGDRFGWDTMTATVAGVYHGLPAQERSQACIFTENYGEASALTFLGTQYGLPQVISGHNNFYIWGPGTCSGKVLITVGIPLAGLQQAFGNVTQAAVITCNYCVSEEDNLPVYVATNPLSSVQSIWPSVKHFN